MDLAIAFDFLKHFSRGEWVSILRIVLAHGRYGAINVQIAADGRDTGKEYHHIFVTEAELAAALAVAGHEEVEREIAKEFNLDDGTPAKTVFLWTKRVKEPDPPAPAAVVTLPYRLEVGGEVIQEHHRYVIRWVNGAVNPVLYQDGKRVTSAWRLTMDATVPADELGRSANTT